MFSPIKWIKPRLRALCVAFGAADMTLIAVSALGFYFFFDIGYQANYNYHLWQFGKLPSTSSPSKQSHLRPPKEDRSIDQLRAQRTIRACGLGEHDDQVLGDQSFALPAALVGASMGGFFILGAVLIALNMTSAPAARKILCTVALAGEGLFTLVLIIAVTLICSSDGLCPMEYYFEGFQPIMFLLALTLISTFSYKTYEITIIAFYLSEQTKLVEKEKLMAAKPSPRLVEPPPPSKRRGSDKPVDPPLSASTDKEMTEPERTTQERGDGGRTNDAEKYREQFLKYIDGTLPTCS